MSSALSRRGLLERAGLAAIASSGLYGFLDELVPSVADAAVAGASSQAGATSSRTGSARHGQQRLGRRAAAPSSGRDGATHRPSARRSAPRGTTSARAAGASPGERGRTRARRHDRLGPPLLRPLPPPPRQRCPLSRLPSARPGGIAYRRLTRLRCPRCDPVSQRSGVDDSRAQRRCVPLQQRFARRRRGRRPGSVCEPLRDPAADERPQGFRRRWLRRQAQSPEENGDEGPNPRSRAHSRRRSALPGLHVDPAGSAWSRPHRELRDVTGLHRSVAARPVPRRHGDAPVARLRGRRALVHAVQRDSAHVAGDGRRTCRVRRRPCHLAVRA